MKETNMDTDEPRKQSKVLIFATLALVVILCIVAAFTAVPSIVTALRSATVMNPSNFRNANIEFFEKLPRNEIRIFSFSSNKPSEAEQFGFKVAIVPLKRETKRIADQDNKKAHANGIVLVFACYELLHGNKELGKKLLELLKQYDRKITYNYPTGRKGLFGDTGANIHIEELLRAADKLVKGDMSEKDVLEKPASQYNWRKKEYVPTRNAK